MRKEDVFFLGTIERLNARDGSLVIALESGADKTLNIKEPVFAEIEGQLVPFFFSKLEKNDRTARALFLDYEKPERARILCGCKLYSSRAPRAGRADDLERLTGYRVEDATHGFIGNVDHIMDLSHYPVLVIVRGKSEILIPAAGGIVTKVDHKAKLIRINAPEGLIGIYE